MPSRVTTSPACKWHYQLPKSLAVIHDSLFLYHALSPAWNSTARSMTWSQMLLESILSFHFYCYHSVRSHDHLFFCSFKTRPPNSLTFFASKVAWCSFPLNLDRPRISWMEKWFSVTSQVVPVWFSWNTPCGCPSCIWAATLWGSWGGHT